MPQVFASDDELDVEVTLIIAFRFVDPPKPTLGNVIAQIRKGEIVGERNRDGIWVVPSIAQFAESLDDWKQRTSWTHISVHSALPVGFVAIAHWCREHVGGVDGHKLGLFQNKSGRGKLQLTQTAREGLAAGTCNGAVFANTVWAARPADIRIWLREEFGIALR